MKLVPDALAMKLARNALVAQKNSPGVLFGVGVVGMVGSTVLACRATLKMDEVLEESRESSHLLEVFRMIGIAKAIDLGMFHLFSSKPV